MQFLERPSARVGFEVRGDGRPVLFTHGFGDTSATFARTADALAVDHQVVTWDLPGHGLGKYPQDAHHYATETVTDHMRALLDNLAVARAVVVGHSVGGYLSLEFALAHPERGRVLILIDTGPCTRSEQARASWNDFADRCAGVLEADGAVELPTSLAHIDVRHRDTTGLALAARGFLRQQDSRVIDSLYTLTMPTLVIVGAEDSAFLRSAHYLARWLPDARLVIIPGAGHTPHLSQPERFDAAVRRFLDKLAVEPKDRS
ncbi:alpha/beta fold hydrolase [Nocardia sp. CA-084685]|uniref:alpha/beta fold hydrolase n=1 Tax=Nocardia sp. CA-084685 TaxID=3239970 RepID=UPI003D956DBC